MPGLGKTSLARAFSAALGASYSRIQFTPDLMPADITGTVVLVDGRVTRPRLVPAGPVFADVVLADEINRASPRTQSALLEAMQEGTVTVGKTRARCPALLRARHPEPVEIQGTYPLPEAQLDRFLLRLVFAYPTREELNEMVAAP